MHSQEDVPFLNHPQQEKEILPWGHILDLNFQVLVFVISHLEYYLASI